MNLERYRVLLVDDDEDDYLITADLLSEIDGTRFDLDWVASYAEGLEAITRREHDVYLLDYRLGGKHTGLELLREAIRSGCREPIILLTGLRDREIDMEAMSTGAADYLVKGQINAPLLERSIRYSLRANQNEKKLAQMAEFDGLTGLPNRHLFQDRFAQQLALARRQKGVVGLMFLDLDRFKLINDTLGHSAGDKLLTIVSERLQQSVRESDTVARLGGDEFVVILPDINAPQNIILIARRIIKKIRQPVQFDIQEIFPAASIGISLFPHDGSDTETLLRKADMAMYQAKASSAKKYAFASDSLNKQVSERFNLEGKLHRALERKEFIIDYQPQFDLRSGDLVGGEALLRWKPAEHVIAPGTFIPLLEETGLIVPVGSWVIQTVCQQYLAWQKKGFGALRLAVNLSGRQLAENDIVDLVEQIMLDTEMPEKMLELELTESMVIGNVQHVREILHGIRSLGISLAMDDFGTGYSSLNCLKHFPFDRIKIDRSFVANIGINQNDEAIIRGIIAIAHDMGMDVVAEGVEEEKQVAFLKDCDCDLLQGFLLGRPMSVKNFTDIMQTKCQVDGP